MQRYILQRVFLALITLWIVTVLLFLLLRAVPGNAVEEMLSESVFGLSTADKAKLIKAYGLDQPLLRQYFTWIGGFIQGDLGKSIVSNVDVATLIKERLPNTLVLGTMTLLLSLSISIPIGIIAAIRVDRAPDYLARGTAVLGLSIPHFWLGLMVIVFPAHYLHLTPPMKYVPFQVSPWGYLQIFLVPALVNGLFGSSSVIRMVRSMLLEVLRSDYIRTAYAKGLGERMVVVRHALKNALIPVVTIIGTQVAFLLGGSVIMETLFGIPGVGALMRESITSKDYPVVQSVTVVLASFVLFMNLLVDIAYGFLDPRIRFR